MVNKSKEQEKERYKEKMEKGEVLPFT